MWIMRGLNALLLCLVMVLFLFFVAGFGNIGGFGKVKRMKIGKLAPDFLLQDASGKTWKISSLKSRLVFPEDG